MFLDRANVTSVLSPPSLPPWSSDGSGKHGASTTQLDVVRVDRRCWRVSDPSIVASDHRRLTGFIERLDHDRYEVLWSGAPIGGAYVASFALALGALADRTDSGGATEGHK